MMALKKKVRPKTLQNYSHLLRKQKCFQPMASQASNETTALFRKTLLERGQSTTDE